MRLLGRISTFCKIWVERSLGVLGVTMALAIVLQVIFRYLLNNSLFWSEELARYLLVWLSFLGASCAYYRRAHPGIDVLTSRLQPGVRKFFALAVHAVSLSLFWVMIYHGSQFAYFVRLQISPALGIPKWLLFSVIPLSGVLFSIHCLSFIATIITGQHRHER